MLCGDHGTCTLRNNTGHGQSEAYCACDSGWGGPLCINVLNRCSMEFFANIFTSIYEINRNAGMDCKYIIGLDWNSLSEWDHGPESDMDNNNLSDDVSSCLCLKVLFAAYEDWANNMNCVIEETFSYSFRFQLDKHCPNVNECTETTTMIMKKQLQRVSTECNMFIGLREYQPLSWRTPLKCSCLLSLGTRAQAAHYMHCPFALHAAGSAMIAYENCADPEVAICDFDFVWTAIREALTERYPSALAGCSQALYYQFTTTPASGGMFSTADMDSWCLCYDAIATWWSEGLDVIDCLPVTFFEYSIRNLWQTVCYDPELSQREVLWNMYEFVIPAASLEMSIGAWCYNSVVMMAFARNVPEQRTARLVSLVCQCINGIAGIQDHKGLDFSWTPLMVDPYLMSTLGITTQYCYNINETPRGPDVVANQTPSFFQTDTEDALVADYSSSSTHQMLVYLNIGVGIITLLLCARNCGWCILNKVAKRRTSTVAAKTLTVTVSNKV